MAISPLPTLSFFNAGTTNINGVYNVSGSTTGSNNSNTVTFDAASTVQSLGSLSIGANGTYNFNSGEALSTPTLTMTGGTLQGSDNLTMTGTGSNLSAGTIGGSGTLTFASGSDLGISGSVTLNRSVFSQGTVSWTTSTSRWFRHIHEPIRRRVHCQLDNGTGVSPDVQQPIRSHVHA